MPELIAKTALDGQAALTLGGTTLAEVDHGQITSIALLPGGGKAAAKGLKALGLTFPQPNSFVETAGARLVWTGREQAFLIGAPPPAIEGAVLTDQSGAWASIRLSGPLAELALARYVPMDLRPAAFAVGQSARTGLYHMSAVLMRTGPQDITVMVFRSMARTAWHEIEVALRSAAARAA